MATSNEKIELRLVASADLKAIGEATSSLGKVDQSTQRTLKTTHELAEAQKQLAKEARLAQEELKRALGVGPVNPSATLASTYFRGQKSQAQLREEERQAGLRTERTMAAEDAERQRAADRRRRFLEDTQARRQQSQAQRDAGFASADDGGTTIGDLFSNLRASTAGILTAAGGAAAAAAKGLREYASAQRASAALDAALATRGQLVEDYRQKVHALAQEFASATAMPKQVWIEALTDLTQAGANSSNIEKLSKGIEDLAGIMNGNVPRASLAMQKAMQGNFENLREWGIVVPEAATLAQKLDSALQQAADKGANQLRSRSQTLSGQFENLKNASFDLLGVLGGFTARSPLVQGFFEFATKGAEKLVQVLGGSVPPMVNFNNRVADAARMLQEARQSAAHAVREFNSIEQASNRAAQALQRQRQASEQLRRTQDELADSQLQLQLAQIDEAVRTGRMSERQGIMARATARRRADAAQFAREQSEDSETISASERRINQIGSQQALLASQRASLEVEERRITAARQAAAAAADAENRANAAERALRSAPSEAAFAVSLASGGQGGIIPSITPAQRAALQRNAAATRAEADRLRGVATAAGPIDEQRAAEVSARLSETIRQLTQLAEVIDEQVPDLQHDISEARLRRDARRVRFGFDQQREGIETRGELAEVSQPQSDREIAELRGALSAARTREDLIFQLRQALQLRQEATVTGFTEIIAGINADIRNIQAQLRSLGTRR